MKENIDADCMIFIKPISCIGLALSIISAAILLIKPLLNDFNNPIYLDNEGFWKAINRESLTITYFDTENEAVDYYLDKYDSTKEFKQKNLFNP
ncbi:MAG: hypothetical protein LBR46_08575 [Prevotella sp.]|jgi:hypothetical protein|nr:hypothetical protein [Prevotella sp.]